MYRYIQNRIGENIFNEIKSYIDAGYFTNVNNIDRMNSVDFAILKRILSLASEHSQLPNLVCIYGIGGRISSSINIMIVRDLKAFKPIIERVKFMNIPDYIIFRELSDIKIKEISKLALWGIEFNYRDEPKTKISFKGIQIGDIKVDDILIESDDKNVAESLKEAINELMSKYEEYKTDKLEIEKTMQARKSKKEKCENDNKPYTHDKFIRFIGESFDGYEITEMVVNHKNATEPVLKIVPEIKKMFDSHRGEWEEGEYTIVITNTGICLIERPELTMIVSMRDDKIDIRMMHRDFIDVLTTGNNAKHIAAELKLNIK